MTRCKKNYPNYLQTKGVKKLTELINIFKKIPTAER